MEIRVRLLLVRWRTWLILLYASVWADSPARQSERSMLRWEMTRVSVSHHNNVTFNLTLASRYNHPTRSVVFPIMLFLISHGEILLLRVTPNVAIGRAQA